MVIRYLVLALVWGLSTPINAQQTRVYASCWIESSDKELSGYNYRLQIVQQNEQTTLTIYYPWAEPRFNPRYIIRYGLQGKGTWQESTHAPRTATTSLLQNPRGWRVVFDSTQCTIYTTKRARR